MSYSPNSTPQSPYGPPQAPSPYGQAPHGTPYYNGAPAYPPPQQQPKRGRRWLWIVLGVVLGFVLLGGIGIFALVNVVTHNPATDTVNHYYTAIHQQDYATAYTYLDASGITYNQQALTQSLYQQGAQTFDAQKGKVSDYSITGTSLSSSNGVNTATFTVRVTRKGQPYDVHLQLKQEGGNWKIVSIDNI